MDAKKAEYIKKFAEAMQGMTFREWETVKSVIDTSFNRQKCELEKQLQLASVEEIDKLMQDADEQKGA